jgi:hypothetical protein
MAWGRHAPRTVEPQWPGDESAAADAERLGIDADVENRPAHEWEVDEAASWEPVVPDTWDPPSDSDLDEDSPTGDAASWGDEAAWSDAARSEHEWVGTAADQPPAGYAEGGIAQRADRESRFNRRAGDEFVRSREPAARGSASEPETQPPARMALGLASLAAQRMRSEVPAGDGLVTGPGVLRQTANGLVAMGERVLAPATQVASIAVRGVALLPVVGAPVRAALRSGQWLANSGARVRDKIRASVPGGARRQGREAMAAVISRLSPGSSTEDGQLDQSRLDAEEPVQTFR